MKAMKKIFVILALFMAIGQIEFVQAGEDAKTQPQEGYSKKTIALGILGTIGFGVLARTLYRYFYKLEKVTVEIIDEKTNQVLDSFEVNTDNGFFMPDTINTQARTTIRTKYPSYIIKNFPLWGSLDKAIFATSKDLPYKYIIAKEVSIHLLPLARNRNRAMSVLFVDVPTYDNPDNPNFRIIRTNDIFENIPEKISINYKPDEIATIVDTAQPWQKANRKKNIQIFYNHIQLDNNQEITINEWQIENNVTMEYSIVEIPPKYLKKAKGI